MDKLIKLALMIFAEMRLTQRVSHFSGAAKWLVLAAVCGIGAGGALITALWIYLIPRIGADGAALAMGVLLAALSGLFALVARATLNPSQPTHIPHTSEDDPIAEIRDLFARHKGSALVSAILAGLAMGNGRK